MTQSEQVAEDLEYVKAAVERNGQTRSTPIAIPLIWAGVMLAGCVLNDVLPRYCWIFWMTLPTLGSLASGIIGGRAAHLSGQYDHQDGMRQGMHWGSLFFAAIPLVLMTALGRINGWQLGQLSLLLSGLAYYLARVHIDRRYVAPGLAMIASSALLTSTIRGAWSAVGVLISLSLVLSFTYPWRRNRG